MDTAGTAVTATALLGARAQEVMSLAVDGASVVAAWSGDSQQWAESRLHSILRLRGERGSTGAVHVGRPDTELATAAEAALQLAGTVEVAAPTVVRQRVH